jgi:hypothetical protein
MVIPSHSLCGGVADPLQAKFGLRYLGTETFNLLAAMLKSPDERVQFPGTVALASLAEYGDYLLPSVT